MKTNDQKLQILLANQKINKLVNEAFEWYFTTDQESVQVGPYTTFIKFKGRDLELLRENAMGWWAQFGETQKSLAAGDAYIHLFEGTSQALSLWFNEAWIIYEIPHYEEVSELFDKLGLRMQRKERFRNMANVTLFRLAN